MTSRKDSVIESDLASHFDADLEEQMSGLKLKTLSLVAAENSDTDLRSRVGTPESTENARIENSGSIVIDQSESGTPDEIESLEPAAQQLVIDPLKMPLPSSTPSHGNSAPASVEAGGPEVHFEGIESKLLEYLARADGVKMCAAWFTSTKIAAQLSLMGDVGLIIGSTEKITPGHPEYRADWVHTLLTDLPNMVFVYGGASGKRMMHNKFMVLFRESRAYAVITGSYNYTYSAGENWENIVYIESDELGQKFSAEYARIQQHCQPLNRYLRR